MSGGEQAKIEELRRREVQAIGAALSLRDWQGLEQAYSALRDKLDAMLIAAAPEITRLTTEVAAKDEALRFYAEEWEQDVDAEQTAQGWTGRIGEVRPTEALCNDFGQRARAALNGRNSQ